MAERWREADGVMVSNQGRMARLFTIQNERKKARLIARVWHGPQPAGTEIKVTGWTPKGVRYVKSKFAGKLDAAMVRSIRAGLAAGLSLEKVAAAHSVSTMTVHSIKHGKIWRDVV